MINISIGIIRNPIWKFNGQAIKDLLEDQQSGSSDVSAFIIDNNTDYANHIAICIRRK